jgi:hypothetical protein
MRPATQRMGDRAISSEAAEPQWSIAANSRFAAATPLRWRADLGCRGGVGGSSCPRLLRHPRRSPRREGCSTSQRHDHAPRRRRRLLGPTRSRPLHPTRLPGLPRQPSLGPATAVGELSGPTLADWFRSRYVAAAPATWNRELATLRSAVGWWRRCGWLAVDPTDALERRRERVDAPGPTPRSAGAAVCLSRSRAGGSAPSGS